MRAHIATVKGTLDVPVGNAITRWEERAGLLLRIEDEDGVFGQGEASPLPGFADDSLERARASLRALSWDRLEIADEGSVRLAVPRALAHLGRASPSAHCAMEVAILEQMARKQGRPLHQLLGAKPTAESALPLAALLPIDSLDAALTTAERWSARGITVFKAKVGRDLDAELAVLARFREELGEDVGIRLDANRSLKEQDLDRALARFAELSPEYVEEPAPLARLVDMKDIPVPIALDETLGEPDGELWASRALDAGVASVLVLKPMVLGGLLRAMRLARMAARKGGRVSVSHCFDGPVALAASAELALAAPASVAAGLAPHRGLSIWPSVRIPAIDEDAIRPHHCPGLGVDELEVEGWQPL